MKSIRSETRGHSAADRFGLCRRYRREEASLRTVDFILMTILILEVAGFMRFYLAH